MSLKLRVLGNKPILNIVSCLKDLFELGSDRVSIEVLFFGLKGLGFGLLVLTSFASMSGSMLLSEVMRPESLLGLDVSTPGMFPKVKFIRILCLCDVIDPFSSSPTLRWNVLPSSVILYWEFSEGINFCSFFGIILSMSRSSAHFESKALGWDS